jgi:SPP1 gp7 family putative phage head morphogenesis protein
MTYTEMQEKAYDITDNLLKAQERKILGEYRSSRDEILSLVKDAYANHLVGVDPADYYTVLSQYNRLDKLNKSIKGVYTSLARTSYKDILTGQLELFEESYYRQQYATMLFADSAKFTKLNPVIQELSVTGDISVWQGIRNKALKEDAKIFIPKSGKTLKRILTDNATMDLIKVQQVVKQVLVNGTSYARQAKELKNTFNNLASNAIRVARTEGTRNSNAGAYLNAQEASKQVPMKRQWYATRDDRTRDRHGKLDGQVVAVDEPFRMDGMKAMYPGDWGEPSMDINCRCTVLDIIAGLEPTVQRVRNSVTGKNMIASFAGYDEYEKAYL